MNKKGFTLIELLAVIIILSMLALLASTSVTKVVRNSKSDLYNAQLESIKSAAKAWGADNLNKLPSNGECGYLTLKDLKEYGLIDSSIKNPRNNKEFSDNLKIKINSESTKFETTNITYEVDAKNIDNCKHSTATCTVVSGDGTKKGDEIDCFGERFYVIKNDGDNIEMLAKYNLNVGSNAYSEGIIGIQNEYALGTRGSTKYGILPFASNLYWDNENYSPAGSSSRNYIYDNNSLLYDYVENYENYLKEKGVKSASALLISYEQLESLGCSGSECDSALEWVYSTNYWIGSGSDIGNVYVCSLTYTSLYMGGEYLTQIGINNHNFSTTSTHAEGVRPVITISSSEI